MTVGEDSAVPVISQDASSLTPLTEANKLIYLVSGICDSSESGVVTVTAGDGSASESGDEPRRDLFGQSIFRAP